MTAPVTSSRYWPAVEDVLLALTPVWWVLRGWVWFVVLSWAATGGQGVFVPRDLGGALVLAAVVLLSVQLARGRVVPTRRWAARSVRAAHVLAVVLVLPLVLTFWNAVENRAAYGSPSVVYEPGVVEYVEPEAGVWVDGMQVSNLFVYDAEGNPLEGVQVFDDRGRQVRTVDGDEWAEWYLPGFDEPWSFTSTDDSEGRPRWNVYPLRGAPAAEWTQDEVGRRFVDRDGELRVPPRPFAKAPSVPSAVLTIDASEPPTPDGEAPDAATPDGEAPDAATPEGTTPDAATPAEDAVGGQAAPPVDTP